MYTNQIEDEYPYTISIFEDTDRPYFEHCNRMRDHYIYERFVFDDQCSHVIKYYTMEIGWLL